MKRRFKIQTNLNIYLAGEIHSNNYAILSFCGDEYHIRKNSLFVASDSALDLSNLDGLFLFYKNKIVLFTVSSHFKSYTEDVQEKLFYTQKDIITQLFKLK